MGRKSGTRRPTSRRTRDTTKEVVPEVGKHAHTGRRESPPELLRKQRRSTRKSPLPPLFPLPLHSWEVAGPSAPGERLLRGVLFVEDAHTPFVLGHLLLPSPLLLFLLPFLLLQGKLEEDLHRAVVQLVRHCGRRGEERPRGSHVRRQAEAPAASPGEVASVPVGRRASPGLLTSDVEHCGGGPSPAPWQPSHAQSWRSLRSTASSESSH